MLYHALPFQLRVDHPVPETHLQIQALEHIVVVVVGQVIGAGQSPMLAQLPGPQGTGAVTGRQTPLGLLVDAGMDVGTGKAQQVIHTGPPAQLGLRALVVHPAFVVGFELEGVEGMAEQVSELFLEIAHIQLQAWELAVIAQFPGANALRLESAGAGLGNKETGRRPAQQGFGIVGKGR